MWKVLFIDDQLDDSSSSASIAAGELAAMDELGITPDLVIGTSVGALNGALVAAAPETAARTLLDIWLEIDQRHLVDAIFAPDRDNRRRRRDCHPNRAGIRRLD